LADGSTGNRLIVIHAGSEGAMLQVAQIIYKAGSVHSDCHGQMKSTHFKNWVKEKSSSSVLQRIGLI